jgi:hypothetical protein
LKHEREDDDDEKEESNSNKRLKTGDKGKHGGAKMLHNKNQIEELTLKEGVKWKGVFTGKEARKGLPKWGKGKMCPKWHVHGHCFNDCANDESHVPKNEVPVEKKAEMVAWKESKQAA